jgi:hypothetical protein
MGIRGKGAAAHPLLDIVCSTLYVVQASSNYFTFPLSSKVTLYMKRGNAAAEQQLQLAKSSHTTHTHTHIQEAEPRRGETAWKTTKYITGVEAEAWFFLIHV